MAERPQNPGPMVRCAAGFDPDHRRRKRLEEGHHLLAPQLLTQNHLLGGVQPMKLEKMFVSMPIRLICSTDGPFCLRSATTSFWHNRCRRGPSTPSPIAEIQTVTLPSISYAIFPRLAAFPATPCVCGASRRVLRFLRPFGEVP